MKKRLIALIIASILIFQSAVFVTAQEVKNNKEDSVFTLLAALSILKGDGNGNYRQNELLTREEYAALILRLTALDSMVDAYNEKETCFKDVPATHWSFPYIGVAKQVEIIDGISADYFGVGNNVKLNEAVKILVSALGYKKAAEDKGGYPSGYINMALKLGLLKNIESNEYLTRGEACQLLYNSFSVNINNEITGVEEGRTVLNTYLGFSVEEGVLEETYHYQSEQQLLKDYVKISGNVYYAPLVQADEYLGCNIKYYIKKIDSQQTVYFISPIGQSKDLTVYDEAIMPDTSLTSFRYSTQDNKVMSASLSDKLKIYKNGLLIKRENAVSLDLIPESGVVTLKDVDRNGAYDIAIVNEYKNYIVSYISEDTIYCKYSEKIELEDSLDDVECYKNGMKIGFSELRNGDVISVSQSADKSRIIIYASEEYLVGSIIEKDESDADRILYTISDDEGARTTLSVAANYKKAMQEKKQGIVNLKINSNQICRFYLDTFGRIADVLIEQKSETGLYGYLYNAALKSGISNSVEFEILTAYNRFEFFKTSKDKVKFGRMKNSNYQIDKVSADEIMSSLIEETVVKKQLIKYVLNENSEIIELYLADKNEDPDHFSEVQQDVREYDYYNGVIGQRYVIDENTAMFYVNYHGDYKYLMAAGSYINTLINGDNINELTFYDREGNYLNAVLMVKRTAQFNPYATRDDGYRFPIDYVNSPVLYIDDISVKMGNDGEFRTYLTGYQNGELYSIAVSDELEYYSEGKENLKEGIAIQYTSNISEIGYALQSEDELVIKTFKTVFDFTKENDSGISWEYSDVKNKRPRISFMWGNVEISNPEFVTLNCGSENYGASLHENTMILEYDESRRGFKLLDYSNFAKGDKVFIRQRYLNTREAIIYKKMR